MRWTATRIRNGVILLAIVLVSLYTFREPAQRTFQPTENSADFILQDITIRNFSGKNLDSEIQAKRATIDKTLMRVTIVSPNAQISTSENHTIIIKADKGYGTIINQHYQFDRAKVSAQILNAPTVIQADKVHYWPNRNQITGESNIRMKSAGFDLTGEKFDLDTQLLLFKIDTKIKGKIYPK